MLSRAWRLPPQRNFVAIDRGLKVPMSDGTVLLADHYLPITTEQVATVLVRCPYGRGLPFSLLEAQLIAERGFHVLLQSCRGTFGSGGAFEPMRHEITDGQDTVTWLRQQPWFSGKLATVGASYLAFAQWALALDPLLLFLDEPTAGLDPIAAGAFDALIGDLRTSLGLTVFMVTHDLDTLVAVCDRIAVLVDKRLIIGTMAELLDNPHPWIQAYFRGPRGRAVLGERAGRAGG